MHQASDSEDMMPSLFPPDRVLLQWHITERCNLTCKHCYQECVSPPEMAWPDLIEILAQCRAWRRELAVRRGGKPVRMHISITGGEPFVHPQIMPFLETLSASRSEWSFGVLSNGTLIDQALARHMAALRPAFVQVSIDGSEATHDHIRGNGSFARVVEGIRCLQRHGMRVMIAFTASRENYREFPTVANLGRRLGVWRVWADRVVPLGRTGSEDSLTPDETRALVASIGHVRRSWTLWGRHTEIASHRALQFAVGNGVPYRCEAGAGLLTLLAGGEICPCRRMPVVAGHVLREGISETYFNSAVLCRLREHTSAPEGCESCFFSKTCAGGLRCLSAAVHDNPFVADPGCWLRKPSALPQTLTK